MYVIIETTANGLTICMLKFNVCGSGLGDNDTVHKMYVLYCDVCCGIDNIDT